MLQGIRIGGWIRKEWKLREKETTYYRHRLIMTLRFDSGICIYNVNTP